MAFDTPINSNDQSFDRVLRAGLPVLALFSAGAPASSIEEKLKQIAKTDSGSVLVAKIRADENPALVERFGIRAPSLITFKNENEYSRAELPDADQITAHAAYLLGRGPKPAAPPPPRAEPAPSTAGQTSSNGGPAGVPVHVTDESFAREVLGSSLPVMVDFWADWCGPCHRIAPTLEKLAREYSGRLRIAKLDVDRNPNMSRQYQVQSIPTLFLVKNGKIIDRLVGAYPEPELRRQAERLLNA